MATGYALVAILAAFVLGALVGATLVIRWYLRRITDPEVCKNVLREFYKRAHPHWLYREDAPEYKVCPVCGWSEREGLGSDQRCEGDRHR